MLPKPNRLQSHYLFQKTMAGHRLCSNGTMAVFGLTRRPVDTQPTRFGFVVSKKVDKRAVRRNRLRRRLREIVRTRILVEQPAALNTYGVIVVVARAGGLVASYEELQNLLVGCLCRNPSPARSDTSRSVNKSFKNPPPSPRQDSP